MRHLILKIAVALVLATSGPASAAVSPEEAKQLGTTLTPMGAEKAGNKDGTIPEYTGGLTTPPPTFKKGSGVRPNPFADEKPLFSITSANMDQYADKLTNGMKEILKRRPTYRIDVYPTHRSAAFPKYVLDNTIANATRAKTGPDGDRLEGAIGGIPFPIPKTGVEVMWNHLTRYVGHVRTNNQTIYYVDSAGTSTLVTDVLVYFEYPYYDPKRTSIGVDDNFYVFQVSYIGPSRYVGRETLFYDNLTLNRRAYLYDPGQRRVRLTPDTSYDTPIATVGGIQTYDDQELFTGKLDRYDFKLLGKKEIIIPYNNYKAIYECKFQDHAKTVKKHHLNPDCERWELHRVWVVEATLKPGKRHIYAKRIFYFDEDTWGSGLAESYDASGKLFRVIVGNNAPHYDVLAGDTNQNHIYDLSSNALGVWQLNEHGHGIKFHAPRPARSLTPEALQGAGIR